jgi:hypothetical protein
MENSIMEQTKKSCVACERSSEEVPLLTLDYGRSTFSVCPQHLPVFIHAPLVGKLAGAENIEPAEHHD